MSARIIYEMVERFGRRNQALGHHPFLRAVGTRTPLDCFPATSGLLVLAIRRPVRDLPERQADSPGSPGPIRKGREAGTEGRGESAARERGMRADLARISTRRDDSLGREFGESLS